MSVLSGPLAGRVAVVSGGGRGLGRTFCPALERWGRLDICVANAGIGVGGMFHKQSASSFEDVLSINLLGSIRLARAAMAVMRPAGYGRIILVASTGGLHGDIGLSAYAASKGACWRSAGRWRLRARARAC